MIKIILSILLFSQASNALSKREYERGFFQAPIVRTDYSQKVRTAKAKSLRDTLDALKGLRNEIQRAARAFNINPLHIAGAIAGEHALNVSFYDSLQNANIKRRMVNEWVDETADKKLFQEIQQPVYGQCRSIRQDYDFWYCIVNTWYQKKNGSVINFLTPQNNAYKQFTNTYFNPNGIGKTFGLGQLSPLRALMVSDMVSNVTNIPRMTFRQTGNSHQAYSNILDNEKVVYFVAATIRKSIDAYREIARFDISENPGVVATLYNIGNERFHAHNRFRENIRRIREDKGISAPTSNSFGRWVLQNQETIEGVFR